MALAVIINYESRCAFYCSCDCAYGFSFFLFSVIDGALIRRRGTMAEREPAENVTHMYLSPCVFGCSVYSHVFVLA